MSKKQKILSALVLVVLFGAAIVLHLIGTVSAELTSDRSVAKDRYETYVFFASATTTSFSTTVATTTNATSTNINSFTNSNDGRIDNGYFVIAGAKKVNLYFQRGDQTGGGNTGTSTFRIQTSPDGTLWDDFNRLEIASSTSRISTKTTVGNVILSAAADFATATGTVVAAMEMEDNNFFAIRCIVQETVDGNHQCKAAASW